MLFWASRRRKFYATTLTPARKELLRKKYPSIHADTMDTIFSRFSNEAEYIEWILRQVAQTPDVEFDLSTVLAYKDLIEYWEKAKKVQDPRIQQHPQFHQTGKWDIGAYNPDRLHVIQTRYPVPVKPRELIFNHNLPAKLVARKENQDGVWDLVELNVLEVLDQAEKELYDGYNMVHSLLTDTLKVRVFNIKDILVMDDGFFSLFPLSIMHNTDTPQGMLQSEVENFVYQNITGPLVKAGWFIHHDTSTNPSNPGFDLIPSSIAQVTKLACRYGEGTKWCTTNPGVAIRYLKEGPLYIVLKDGYPVAQAWASISQPNEENQVMNRKDTAYSERDPGYGQVSELLRTHTQVPVVNWEAVEELVTSYIERYRDHIDENYIPQEDFNWLPEGHSADSSEEIDNLMWVLRNGVDWDRGMDKDAKRILRAFIKFSEYSKSPGEDIEEEAAMAVLEDKDWLSIVTADLDPDDENYEQDLAWYDEYIWPKMIDYLDSQVEALNSVLESASSAWYSHDEEIDKLGDRERELYSAIRNRDWEEMQGLAKQAAQTWAGFSSDFDEELLTAAFGSNG